MDSGMAFMGDSEAFMDVEPSQSYNPQIPSEPRTSVSQAGGIAEAVLTKMDHLYEEMRALVASVPQARDPFRDLLVKVHIRRPDRDAWTYLGRGIVSQEGAGQPGQSYRIVVRSAASKKIMTSFGEDAAVQAEKRGNFVVIGCVEGNRVVSWSLNAQNNSETLRLLASIDLACYSRKHLVTDPHNAHRRRITRIIKDDRKRRHKRRKDQDSMVAAFARTGLSSEAPEPLAGPSTI
ncbi:hypothetical protein POSPLADRAFT_1130446 [Postia placenta MAD-698-R-SB12]|uniref:Uncharacterized protein n=1 Tax=Postia placenta MAD-698-R-SB12 TaxID=670580 RepID=A0A1X6NFU8_9APHY|nr:hypothetical protein POSPLADRAFT_1130446 [Postia placenta MAD-698-R-SB12]OSX67494.1 hypothetical protein POSPLADRAFT_1130446 [Postia placenta MAD-698-R-SB12]